MTSWLKSALCGALMLLVAGAMPAGAHGGVAARPGELSTVQFALAPQASGTTGVELLPGPGYQVRSLEVQGWTSNARFGTLSASGPSKSGTVVLKISVMAAATGVLGIPYTLTLADGRTEHFAGRHDTMDQALQLAVQPPGFDSDVHEPGAGGAGSVPASGPGAPVLPAAGGVSILAATLGLLWWRKRPAALPAGGLSRSPSAGTGRRSIP